MSEDNWGSPKYLYKGIPAYTCDELKDGVLYKVNTDKWKLLEVGSMTITKQELDDIALRMQAQIDNSSKFYYGTKWGEQPLPETKWSMFKNRLRNYKQRLVSAWKVLRGDYFD